MNSIGVEKVFDLLKWQKVQDSISDVTRLAIITVDYKGVPLTRHSNCTAFCSRVREDATLFSMCQKCDSRGGLEALRSNQPYAYICHFGLVDVAIPIIIYDKYVGSIMVGQVKAKDESSHLERVVLQSDYTKAEAFLEECASEYQNFPFFTYERLIQSVTMIDNIMKYMINEITRNNPSLEMYDKTDRLHKKISRSDLELHQAQTDHLANMQEEMSRLKLDHYIRDSDNLAAICKNEILKPAFRYMQEHKHEKITMASMASICHISESYFSRVFSKEVGESFSTYTSKLKVSWAKQLLEKTDMTINQVANELGYSEPGYFIKTFKKHEGMTPAVYQKYHYLAQ